MADHREGAAPATTTRRLAVVVVPGIGDEAEGEVSGTLAGALRALAPDPPAAAAPGLYRLADAPGPLGVHTPGAAGYDATRLRLRREAAGRVTDCEVDLVEMRWADLSSFPSKGLLAFFGTLFGLALQLATPGLEVTYREDPSRTRSGLWWFLSAAAALAVAAGVVVWLSLAGGFSAGAVLAGASVLGLGLALAVLRVRGTLRGLVNAVLEALSWWLAAILVPLTVVTGLAGAALWFIVAEPGGLPPWITVSGVLVVGLLACWTLGKGIAAGGWVYGRGRWRHALDPRWLTFLPLLVGAGIFLARLGATETTKGAASQTVLAVAGFGLRGAWFVALVLVGATLAGVVTLGVVRRERFGSGALGTAVLAATMAPLLTAAAGTLLIAGIGTVAWSNAEDARWGTAGVEVVCLADAHAWEWGESGGCARNWSATARDVAALLGERERLSTGRRLADAAPRDTGSIALEESAIRGLGEEADRLEAAAGMTPVEWTKDLFAQVALPLLGALALLLALGALILMGVLAAGDPAGDRPRGSAVTRMLTTVGSRPIALIVAVLGMAATTLGCLYWATDRLWGGPGREGPESAVPVGGVLSTLALVLLVLARFVPVDPRRWSDEAGGRLKVLRGVLDRAYDVATYLRIDDGRGPRMRTVARFRATLEEVLRPANGYAGVVVAAHSQGSVYTVATLFGDPHRRGPEQDGRPEGVLSWRERGRDTSWIAERLVLVTFGSPLAQLYRVRLPDQYDWVGEKTRRGGRQAGEPLWWANVFRSRDFVGRSLFRDPLDDDALPDEGCWVGPASPGGEAPRLTDACLRGAGHHVGYWGDRELALWVDAGIRCLATPEHPRTPPGTYEPC